MTTVIMAVLGKFKGWIAAAVALLSALAWAFFKGRSGAMEQAEQKQRAERSDRNASAANELIKAAKEKADVDADLGSLGDADAADRLRRDWMRD